MRQNRKSLTWQTASTFAVCCFLGGVAVSLGVHEHRVGAAVEQAREQARVLDEERTKLEETLAKAREVSEVSGAVSDEQVVAEAAAQLTQAASAAAYAAEQHNITVSAAVVAPPTFLNPEASTSTLRGPYATSPVLTVDATAVLDEVEDIEADGTTSASAEPTTSPSTEPSASASATPEASASTEASAEPEADEASPETAPTSAEEAEALAQIVDEAEVAQVLRGEVDDLETVAATVARLEQATAQLDDATRRIEGTTAVLEAATAEATLELANVSLDKRIDSVEALADAATSMVDAVDGKVVDDSAITDVTQARKALQELKSSDVDRDDAEAVEALKASIVDAVDTLEQTEEALYDSHQAWVKKENKRRDAVNAERTAAYEAAVEAAYDALTADYRTAANLRQSGWSGAPTGASYSNGYLPSSSLCTLSFASGQTLQCSAAKALEAADDDYYAQTGSHLGIVSSYRSYSAQVATKASRGYFAAAPGSSNHGWGMAADFSPASATWMRTHGEDYGWVHPTWARPGGSKPESWHLEFVAPGVEVSLPDEPNMLAHVKSSLTA
ncbi:D-alanyl-D-alanine carboxypeptidase family protein [Demequina gelatinilytica]|uniref:D-alanyl-D-alanine carboxypeptidase family protein n=1 Tax=Demequina gelatinilytica TaxID=1638980 RepID=UPI0007861E1E|nr:D-alanyl-D-alanine carboxypeptidase family protein [Demequina gelatinilytica]